MKTKLSKSDNGGNKNQCVREGANVRVYSRSENGNYTTLENIEFPSVGKAKAYFGAL